MNYDVYHGTKEDFEQSGGKLIERKVSMPWLKGYFKRDTDAALDGELIPMTHIDYGEGFIWIEDAM